MRVLIVTKIFPNAAEPRSSPFNLQQFSALARHCEVDVLATIPWFPGASLTRRWSQAGRLTAVPFFETIAGLAVTHPRTFYVPRFGHGWAGMLHAASLAPHLFGRRDRFDIILGSWAYPDGMGAVLLGRAFRRPVVVKLHGSDIDVLGQIPQTRRNLRWALPRADRIVAVSASLARAAIDLGVRPEQVDVIRNGVDTELFRPRDRQACREAVGHGGDDRRWLLHVGRLEEAKGVLDTLEAFARMPHTNAALVLLGEGSARARCVARAACSDLAGRVIFAGAQPLKQVPLWMGASQSVVLASHHEGTPNVLLEALACGRRVVATTVGGIPDVVFRGELGLLVPPGDRLALTSAIDRALSEPYDPAEVVRLGASGSWDESARRLLASLQRALAEQPLRA